MNIYPCGRKVILKLSGLNGFITAVNIRGKNIQYEISFLENNVYKTQWF